MITGHVPAVRAPPDHAASREAHLRRILREYEIHQNQHRPHRSLRGAAPLGPLPKPVDLEQYRVRRQTRASCMINEYRLVA
jgi:putative transposase